MNEEQLKEFFDAIDKPYDDWQRQVGWHGKKLLNPPYYSLAHKLTSTIFAYSGYENTDVARDKSEKNLYVKKLLTTSLEEPAIIFDCGTYDGKRLKEIIDSLPMSAQKNIINIFGIDSNNDKLHEAQNLFFANGKGKYSFIPINDRIENINFSEYRTIRGQYPKNIILGLENVFLNFNGLSFQHDGGLTGFLSSMTLPKDEIILELHNVNTKEAYPEEVESFFKNYLEKSGLQEILGGTLKSEYDEYGKSVYLTDINHSVKFNGKTYNFAKHHADVWGEAKTFEPRIYIGFSGAVSYDRIFEFLVFNFANNLYVPKSEEINFSGTDMSLKLRNFERTLWLEEAKNKCDEFVYKTYSSPERSTINSGLTAYITLKELNPHYYNRFVYKNSQVIGVEPDAMKSFAFRARYDHKLYPPITTAFPQTSFEKLQFSEKEKWSLDL